MFRNIFENKKYVEHYKVSDLESELGLSQDRLVALALLLGSDYTEGVSGIGIVNAVEVVMAFLPAPSLSLSAPVVAGGGEQRGAHREEAGQPGDMAGVLQAWGSFKEWVKAPDLELIREAAARGRGRGQGRGRVRDRGRGRGGVGRKSRREQPASDDEPVDEDGAEDGAEDGGAVSEPQEAVVSSLEEDGGVADDEAEPQMLREFKDKHRNVRKNWDLPDSFPNPAVIKAYKASKEFLTESKAPSSRLPKFSWWRKSLRRLCLLPIPFVSRENPKSYT